MGSGLYRKMSALRKKIRKMDSAMIAYSGGMDSAFLLRVCREELGDKAVGITILPEDYPVQELAMARHIAKVIGVRHVVVDPSAVSQNPLSEYRKGPMCIGKAYSFLRGFTSHLNFRHVLDGHNKDDARKGRMSLSASKESGFRSPLLECGLTKAEIRMMAKEMGLPDWDHMRGSSKVMLMPMDKKLSALGRFISKNLGAAPVLGNHGSVVTISADEGSLTKLARSLGKIHAKAKTLGFSDVSLRLSS